VRRGREGLSMGHRINERCDGCSACFGQCPTAAIFGEFEKQYWIDEPLCIDCGVCGYICPVEAVLDQYGRVVPRVPRDQRPRPIVDDNSCTGCGTCVAVCPFECRTVVGSPHAGISSLASPQSCVGCGECASICIKGAITMGPLDIALFDPRVEAERLRRVIANTVLPPNPQGARDGATFEKLDP